MNLEIQPTALSLGLSLGNIRILCIFIAPVTFVRRNCVSPILSKIGVAPRHRDTEATDSLHPFCLRKTDLWPTHAHLEYFGEVVMLPRVNVLNILFSNSYFMNNKFDNHNHLKKTRIKLFKSLYLF